MLDNIRFKLFLLVFTLFLNGCSSFNTPQYPLLSDWKTLRDQNVVIQKYDYSCGPASLATLLTYHYKDPVSERTILSAAKTVLSKEAYLTAQKEGLSLFDLKLIAESRGYMVKGVKIPLKALTKIPIPILVHLNVGKYLHFAVLKGVKNNRVYLSDPSRGNLEMTPGEFKKEWQGIALIIFHPKHRPIKGLDKIEKLTPQMLNRHHLYTINHF